MARYVWTFWFLLLTAFGLLAPSLNSPFYFEETTKIAQNEDITSLADLPRRLVYPYDGTQGDVRNRNDPSRPLVYLTYALNRAVSPMPFGFRLVDMLLHVVVAFLIFCLLDTLVRQAKLGEDLPRAHLLAPIVAFLFCAHPVFLNSAGYSYARPYLLGGALTLAAWLVYLAPTFRGKLLVIGCLFAASLLSIQTAVVLIPLLLLTDWLIHPGKVGERLRAQRVLYLTLLGLCAAFLLFRWFYLGGIGDLEASQDAVWPWHLYFLGQPYVFWRYLASFFVPLLSQVDNNIARPDVTTLHYAMGWGGLLAGSAGLYWWAQRYSAQVQRWALFMIGITAVFLLPVSSVLPQVDLMVERRLYPGAFGLIGAFVSLLLLFRSRATSGGRRLLSTFVLAFTVFFVVAAVVQSVERASPKRFWARALEVNPRNDRALLGLALHYKDQGNYRAAIEAFRSLFRLYPGHFVGYYAVARVHWEAGELIKAHQALQTVVNIKPDFRDARQLLQRLKQDMRSNLLSKSAFFDEEYQKKLEANPQDTRLRIKYLRFLILNRKREAARQQFDLIRQQVSDELILDKLRGELDAF